MEQENKEEMQSTLGSESVDTPMTSDPADAPVQDDAPAAAQESDDASQGDALAPGRVKKVAKALFERWLIDAFTGMAQGLFVTLIAGTIIGQIGSWCGNNAFGLFLSTLGNFAKMLMGAGIGVGMAHKLKCKPLVIFAAAVAGLIGAWSMQLSTLLTTGTISNASFLLANNSYYLKMGACGNPIGSYVVALLAIEVASLYAGKTKLDIVLVPLGMILLSLVGVWMAWPFIKLVDLIGVGIALAIEAGVAVKIIVGIFVAVVMGILLTLPTSSAAIWIAITASVAAEYADALSIAGGAAVAGCAAHMVGFAVASFRENKWSGLISQGLGTSMLQIPNLMRNPRILIPEIVASAISGLVAVLLDMRCNAVGGGMGTSGLVGVFGVIAASTDAGIATWRFVLGIILCLFVIPALVSWGVSEGLRKVGWIRQGDQLLQ